MLLSIEHINEDNASCTQLLSKHWQCIATHVRTNHHTISKNLRGFQLKVSISESKWPAPPSSNRLTWNTKDKKCSFCDNKGAYELALITLPLGFITSTVMEPLWTAILSQACKIRNQVILKEWKR